jgi:hypothetical protein
MARKKLSIIHPIKVVAREYQQRLYPPIAKVRQYLANGIGRALEPIGLSRRCSAARISTKPDEKLEKRYV